MKEARLTTDAMLGTFEFKAPLVLFAETADIATLESLWLDGFSITYDATNARARLERPRVP